MNKPNSLTSGACTYLFAYAVIFTFLFITHAFLLRLPYFWDEAGYYIPAARDLLLTGSPIPHTTLSNAHPPLVMFWLAFWWKFSAFTPTTTREAMLMVAAFALVGIWRLARNVTTDSVAAATVLCTALYPVFFCQSSMAHLDMMAAAFTLWGLAMYVERRTVATIVFFSLAALSKETAIVTPMALLAWELLRPLLTRSKMPREAWFLYHSPRHALSFLICLLPLIGWFVYHHHRTGYYLGNPSYLRYNLQATLSPLRIVLALLIRLWHVFGYLNLFLLVLGAAEAMTHAPLREADGSERPRIAINVQLVFLVVLVANVLAESVLGGAVLARYMLPVVPVVILVCISTMRRRIRQWTWVVAIAAAAFVVQLFVPPPYRVAPEDTLLYHDYVLLHKQAADELAKHPQRTILTAWPASDELTRPYLGYVKQALPVIRIENFSAPEIARAAHATDQFDVAYLFSTKFEPPHPLLERLTFGKALQARFFDYHEDLTPQAAAEILGGRITDYQNRNNEWIGLVTIEKVEDANIAAERPAAAALKPVPVSHSRYDTLSAYHDGESGRLGSTSQSAGIEFTIRDYRAADFERLWQIDQLCFPPGIAYTQMELSGFITRRHAITLVGESQLPPDHAQLKSIEPPHSIGGYVIAHSIRRKYGRILTLDIVPQARRFGLATHLMNAAEERLRTLGCSEIYLETAVDNEPALRLYRKLGYEILRTLPEYYASHSLDAFQMGKHL